jgi:antitoxin (DNA-binding transcriptional repressor) of toxin-antitoxin stability system
MLHVKIAQLQDELASLLRKVRAGESVTVYDGETVIARIEPPAAADSAEDFKTENDRIASLVARGIARAPENPKGNWDFLKEPPPKAEASVLEALLEERRESR